MLKRRLNLRNVATILACLAGITVFSGCGKEKGSIEVDTEQDANIVDFAFEGIEGKAAINSIAYTVIAKAKETVDLTALVAEFILSSGATAKVNNIKQESKKTANNFSSPIIYKVTSDNGETMNDWIVTITGGKPSEQGDPHTDVCVEINGVKWAPRNVDTPGTFTDNPEDFGNYYTWDEAKNVCPTNWRLPNSMELQNLYDAGSEWKTINGVNGRIFGSGDNIIFLPAAGKYYYEEHSESNLSGSYWSSCPADDWAMELYFTKDNASSYAGSRNNKQSVRCVKEK